LGALVALACVLGGLGVWQQANGQGFVVERQEEAIVAEQADDATNTKDEAEVAQEDTPSFCVHVDGAVGSPGVVRLEGNDLRVCDAIEAAGGLKEGADTAGVNLAEPLTDGSKIHIPYEGEQAVGEQDIPAGQTMTSGATGDGAATMLVNINTATSEELQGLPGVGEATAQAIIEERTANGPFATIEDLMRVSGIGEKKFAKLRSGICV
jgi:competence protein ComEA